MALGSKDSSNVISGPGPREGNYGPMKGLLVKGHLGRSDLLGTTQEANNHGNTRGQDQDHGTSLPLLTPMSCGNLKVTWVHQTNVHRQKGEQSRWPVKTEGLD